MLPAQIAASALFYTLMGTAYVKGYDAVRRHAPDHLVHFYLVMATLRLLLTATFIALYLLLLAHNREDALRFAAINIVMYTAMMVVTLKLRH